MAQLNLPTVNPYRNDDRMVNSKEVYLRLLNYLDGFTPEVHQTKASEFLKLLIVDTKECFNRNYQLDCYIEEKVLLYIKNEDADTIHHIKYNEAANIKDEKIAAQALLTFTSGIYYRLRQSLPIWTSISYATYYVFKKLKDRASVPGYAIMIQNSLLYINKKQQ